MSKTLIATTTLIGATIGAGILGIPYVVSKSGLLIGIINMLIVAFLVTITALYLGEITLRTKGKHQLTGYAEKYLGKKGKIIMFIALAFGIYSALLAYLIGEGQSLSFVFFNSTNYELTFGIIFWFILSLIAFKGLEALEEGEEFGIIFVIIMILSIIIFYWNKIDPSNLTYFNTSEFFTPFGVIFFAFLGFSAVPEIALILDKQKKFLKRSIIFAYLTCLTLYILFAIIVIGTRGFATPQLATLALGKPFVLLGIITMFTAYLAHTNILIDMINIDLKKNRKKAWLISVTIPIILFVLIKLTNFATFTTILGIGGTISGGITAILILAMIKIAKKKGERKPEYNIPAPAIAIGALMMIFAATVFYEIVHLITK